MEWKIIMFDFEGVKIARKELDTLVQVRSKNLVTKINLRSRGLTCRILNNSWLLKLYLLNFLNDFVFEF